MANRNPAQTVQRGFSQVPRRSRLSGSGRELALGLVAPTVEFGSGTDCGDPGTSHCVRLGSAFRVTGFSSARPPVAPGHSDAHGTRVLRPSSEANGIGVRAGRLPASSRRCKNVPCSRSARIRRRRRANVRRRREVHGLGDERLQALGLAARESAGAVRPSRFRVGRLFDCASGRCSSQRAHRRSVTRTVRWPGAESSPTSLTPKPPSEF